MISIGGFCSAEATKKGNLSSQSVAADVAVGTRERPLHLQRSGEYFLGGRTSSACSAYDGVARSRHATGLRDGWVLVRGVDRRDLKVPRWMLAPECAAFAISERATVDVAALRCLIALAKAIPALSGFKEQTAPPKPLRHALERARLKVRQRVKDSVLAVRTKHAVEEDDVKVRIELQVRSVRCTTTTAPAGRTRCRR